MWMQFLGVKKEKKNKKQKTSVAFTKEYDSYCRIKSSVVCSGRLHFSLGLYGKEVRNSAVPQLLKQTRKQDALKGVCRCYALFVSNSTT